MLTLIGLYLGCNDENPAITAPTIPTIDTIFYRVIVDRLRMRSAPGLSSETVTLLPEGALVKYWSEHSKEKTTVTLRDSSISQYWYMISYADTVGWVFGGALRRLAAESGEDQIIVPGKRVGVILAADSEQDIIDRLGPDQVERGEFMIGEGEFVQATFVYPASDKELILLWHEVDFIQLREVRIRRSASPWITEQGIKVGSSLQEVEEINQGPFLLSGFGWDYAGSTLDWQQGILQSNLALVFAEPEKMHKSLLGDESFSSDHKRMRSANPVVKTMRILFSL